MIQGMLGKIEKLLARHPNISVLLGGTSPTLDGDDDPEEKADVRQMGNPLVMRHIENIFLDKSLIRKEGIIKTDGNRCIDV